MDYLIKMRLLVRERGLKMHNLASLFNKAPSTVNNYLNGKNDMPLAFFIEFCDYFKTPYLYFLEQKQEKQNTMLQIDFCKRETNYLNEISNLKDKIIELQQNNYAAYMPSSKAI